MSTTDNDNDNSFTFATGLIPINNYRSRFLWIYLLRSPKTDERAM